MKAQKFWLIVAAILVVLILAACGGAATTQAPAATEAPAATISPTEVPAAATAEVQTQTVEATGAPTSTGVIVTSPPVVTTVPAISPTATPVVEARVIELEWPPEMRLGESDLIRLALIPSKDGYTVTTEFPEHQTITDTVPVERPGGFSLSASARLDGVGFDIEPGNEQTYGLPLDQPVTWRWTITPLAPNQQRLSILLRLVWTPQPGNPSPLRETVIYSKGLNVQVASFFGLTQREALAAGFVGLAFGSTLSLPLAAYVLRPRRARPSLQTANPNAGLIIEHPPGLQLSAEETRLLKTLFRRYARVTLEAEFRSGYSGARTFLALPVRADGRADAYTIAKLGERDSIQREFENYEAFVKDTLPPMTARIQEAPVSPPSPVPRAVRGTGEGPGVRAVLRYTFIAEPTRLPISLRESLISNLDPSLLEKLFQTFGPNWWLQRKPYTFRLAEEYDRMLPAHFVVEPCGDEPINNTFDGLYAPASTTAMQPGHVVALKNLNIVERRADGKSLSLSGLTQPGYPPLRVRWNSLTLPVNARGRIVATRKTLLGELTAGFELFGLPDPFLKLDALLNERLIATQSTIHGDLNLENILVGPGGFVWLIDFAQTRDGHPLYDFAHLEAEIIAHVLAPQFASVSDYAAQLRTGSLHPLLSSLHSIAARCLFNPSQPREYQLALYLACLGALKFVNLNSHQKQVLYLTAAHLAQIL
ncbi:MAG: phosphotransferase [Chloroflexi bacterium]|nr:phosphotransferase [Chloroflexota bacterium]